MWFRMESNLKSLTEKSSSITEVEVESFDCPCREDDTDKINPKESKRLQKHLQGAKPNRTKRHLNYGFQDVMHLI